MKSINWSRLLTMAAVLSFTAACQFVPQQAPVDEPEEIVQSAVENVEDNTPVNPYLVNRPDVAPAVSARFQRAQAAMGNGDWAQAESELLWLTENYPALSGPFVNLAIVYEATQQFDLAASAYQGAIAANASNVHAYNQYAVFLRRQGQFEQAETTYLQALERWPEYPEAIINIAILYDLYMGRLSLALEYYQTYQALQESPDRQVAGWIIDAERRLKSGPVARGGEG